MSDVAGGTDLFLCNVEKLGGAWVQGYPYELWDIKKNWEKSGDEAHFHISLRAYSKPTVCSRCNWGCGHMHKMTVHFLVTSLFAMSK